MTNLNWMPDTSGMIPYQDLYPQTTRQNSPLNTLSQYSPYVKGLQLTKLLANGGRSSMLEGVGNWIDTSMLGQSLGLSAPYSSVASPMVQLGDLAGLEAANPGVGFAGQYVPQTVEGFAPTELGGLFSDGLSYSPWGMAGGLLGRALGFKGSGNMFADMALNTLGSVGGGMLGSAAGAGAGTIAGLEAGAVLGPIGAVAGALLGTILGSAFADKDYPTAWYSANSGKRHRADALDGGNAEGMGRIGDAVQSQLTSFANQYNIPVTSFREGGFFDNSSNHPNLSGMPGGYGAWINNDQHEGWDEAVLAPNLQLAINRYALLTLQNADLTALTPEQRQFITSYGGDSWDQFNKDFMNQFDLGAKTSPTTANGKPAVTWLNTNTNVVPGASGKKTLSWLNIPEAPQQPTTPITPDVETPDEGILLEKPGYTGPEHVWTGVLNDMQGTGQIPQDQFNWGAIH